MTRRPGTSRLAPQPCPACRRSLDAASTLDGAETAPNLGDLTACLYCGARLRFGVGLVLEPTAELDADGELLRLERTIAAFWHGKGGRTQ